jgi:hypothetical protein
VYPVYPGSRRASMARAGRVRCEFWRRRRRWLSWCLGRQRPTWRLVSRHSRPGSHRLARSSAGANRHNGPSCRSQPARWAIVPVDVGLKRPVSGDGRARLAAAAGWTWRQPTGIAVSGCIAWAREILALYTGVSDTSNNAQG